MRLLRSGTSIVVHAPAKLNLFFEVLGKRGDGYHEIETLMCPISLCDTLCFRDERRGTIQLECDIASSAGMRPPWAGDVPGGGANLVVRAVEVVAAADRRKPGNSHPADEANPHRGRPGRRFERRRGGPLSDQRVVELGAFAGGVVRRRRGVGERRALLPRGRSGAVPGPGGTGEAGEWRGSVAFRGRSPARRAVDRGRLPGLPPAGGSPIGRTVARGFRSRRSARGWPSVAQPTSPGGGRVVDLDGEIARPAGENGLRRVFDERQRVGLVRNLPTRRPCSTSGQPVAGNACGKCVRRSELLLKTPVS